MGVDYCLLFGAVISFVVSAMKRIPFVKKNPKVIAFLLNAALGAFVATHGSTQGIDVNAIMQCIMTQFAASVATHEAVVNPIQDFARSDSE